LRHKLTLVRRPQADIPSSALDGQLAHLDDLTEQ